MTYSISGVVACCGGFPVENATIVVDDAYTLSDENGKFALTGIQRGQHTMKILHRSYQTLETPITITGDVENAILYIQYQGRKQKNVNNS